MRVVLSATITNPMVAIRLASSGDAVAMDYAQIEDGAFQTMPILTTSASATRAADSLMLPQPKANKIYSPFGGTFHVESQSGGESSTLLGLGAFPLAAPLYLSKSMPAVFRAATQGNLTTYSPGWVRGGTVYSFRTNVTWQDKSAALKGQRAATGRVDQVGLYAYTPISSTGIGIGMANNSQGQPNNAVSRLTYFPFAVTPAQLEQP